MKAIFSISIAFSICLTSLIGYPTKEELLEKLYLVTVGTKEQYGKFLKEGVLTDRHQPFIFSHGEGSYYYGSRYLHSSSLCPNNLEVCNGSNFANVVLQAQRGLFYFTPGYVFGDSTSPWRDYEMAILMPLKNVYNRLANLSWGEFVAYDNIPFTNDTIVLVEKSPEGTHYSHCSTATIRPFEKIEDKNDRLHFKDQLIKDVIKEKGGYLVEYNSELDGDHDVDLKVDGEKLRFKAKKNFLASLLNEYITYGYKKLGTNRYKWVDDFLQYGDWYNRNYGFEFYAFMKGALAFIKERGLQIEDTGSFQEAVIAQLLAWDLLSVENPTLIGPSLAGNSIVPTETVEALEQAMQRQVAFYKDKPLQTLYEDLIHKEAYKYKNMPSNPRAFKKSFIKQVYLMNRMEAKAFIFEYKDFLLKTGSDAPYPLDILEQSLIELYDQFQALAGPLITITKNNDLMTLLELINEEGGCVISSTGNNIDSESCIGYSGVIESVTSEIEELLEAASEGTSDKCHLSSHSICGMEASRYKYQEMTDVSKANDSERRTLVEEVQAQMQNKLKDFCEKKENIIYQVYANGRNFSDMMYLFDGFVSFSAEVQPCVQNNICDWLKNKTMIGKGSIIGNTIKDGVLIIRIRNTEKIIASFELSKNGKQTAYYRCNRTNRLYEITAECRELPEDKVYSVNLDIEPLCVEDGENFDVTEEEVIACERMRDFSQNCYRRSSTK